MTQRQVDLHLLSLASNNDDNDDDNESDEAKASVVAPLTSATDCRLLLNAVQRAVFSQDILDRKVLDIYIDQIYTRNVQTKKAKKTASSNSNAITPRLTIAQHRAISRLHPRNTGTANIYGRTASP